MTKELKDLTNSQIKILMDEVKKEIILRGGEINMGIEINKVQPKEVDKCQHDYQIIEKFESVDGIGYLFFCKYCLDMQIKELKSQKEEVKDGE